MRKASESQGIGQRESVIEKTAQKVYGWFKEEWQEAGMNDNVYDWLDMDITDEEHTEWMDEFLFSDEIQDDLKVGTEIWNEDGEGYTPEYESRDKEVRARVIRIHKENCKTITKKLNEIAKMMI